MENSNYALNVDLHASLRNRFKITNVADMNPTEGPTSEIITIPVEVIVTAVQL